MKRLIYIGLILFILSCKSEIKYSKPENLIPKDQMIDMLYDMHIANGTTGIKNKALENNLNYMALVYEKYKIDSIRFAESNLYYIANINEYEDIFEELEKRLELLKTEFDKQRDSVLKDLKEKKKTHDPLKLMGRDTVKIKN